MGYRSRFGGRSLTGLAIGPRPRGRNRRRYSANSERTSLVILLGGSASVLGRRLAAACFRGKSGLFIAADPAVRIKTFQNELRRARPHGIGLACAYAQLLGLFEQPLNLAQFLDHLGRGGRLIQLERPAEFEPLHNMVQIFVVEIAREDLAYREPDQFPRHSIATF